MRNCISRVIVLSAVVLSGHASANLLVNGNFESSSSTTVTPVGWTNIGHSEGVIEYSRFGTPAYDGLYFYDFGGFGDPTGPAGDGLRQTVVTVPGTIYTLTFGLSSENTSGSAASILDVVIGSQLTSFTIPSNNVGLFLKPFVTQTLSYTAVSTSTIISFIQGVGGNGFNDPMIDRVNLAPIPEPTTTFLLCAGLIGVMFATRRVNSQMRRV